MAHELQKTVDGSGCEHVEHPASPAKDSTDNSMNDGPPLPEGYFYSKEFLGSVSAACLGLLAGIAGFSFPAPVLAQINADIGPSNNITWASIVYTLCIAVGLTVVGRLGDVFGRRYVFIVGGLLAVIGSVVAATAQSVNILIAGMTFIGLGASTQVSYFYVIAELVPSQYRFLGNSVGYIFAIPGGAVSPALAHACILHTRPGWRALFYIILGFNSAALICWILFYHPPDFQMKHGDSRRRDYMRNFDYIGTVLLVSGLLLFLLGLQWGGSVYSWDSASVIATIVIGACTLIAFVLWECFGKLKEPLVPMRALRDVGFAAAVVTSGIGASLYYALSIVWPQMVAQVYTSDDFMEIGWEASIVGACWVLGEITSGVLAKYIGKIKQQCTLTLGVATIFLGCMATCGPDTKTRACILMSFSVFCAGWVEGLALTATTLTIPDQHDIGTACGFGGSIRFTITTIATTIYTTVLSSRVTTLLPRKISQAAVAVGLPSSSVAQVLSTVTAGTSLAGIPGVSSPVAQAIDSASREAYAAAFRAVFYTSIAFGILGVVTTLFLPNIERLMTGEVVTRLQQKNYGRSFDQEKGVHTEAFNKLGTAQAQVFP